MKTQTMAIALEAGTIFVQNRSLTLRTLDFETEPYSGIWDVVHSPRSSSLDERIRGTGWNCFFMAAEVRVSGLGGLEARNVHRVLEKIFAKVSKTDFNCLEVTKIMGYRFLGVPYVTVCAHSRHIQRGSTMDFARKSATPKNAVSQLRNL